MQRSLLLGSASPRRAALLAQLGVRFTVACADIDESSRVGEPPLAYVERMAREKAETLVARGALDTSDVLLTADTAVIVDELSLGKPADAAAARAMLQQLSGRRHLVCTAVCAADSASLAMVCVNTLVEFVVLDDLLLDAYLRSDEPWDKAGAYAIQGLGGSLVRRVEGSISNVIGLPLAETRELLGAFGVYATIASGGAV